MDNLKLPKQKVILLILWSLLINYNQKFLIKPERKLPTPKPPTPKIKTPTPEPPKEEIVYIVKLKLLFNSIG